MITRSILWTTATVLAAIIVLAAGCTTGLITSAERIESLRHNGLGCPADGPCLIESLSEVSGLITFAIVPPESLSAEFTKLSIICENCGRTVRGLTLASSEPHAPGGAISFGQGSCVALSRDGYFLTAAHVLDARFVGSPTPPIPSGIHVIVTRDQDGAPVVLPLRVVWRTPPKRQSTTGMLAAEVPDLAIIHAPVRPMRVATCTPAQCVSRGQFLLGGRQIEDIEPSGQYFPLFSGQISAVTPFSTSDGIATTRVQLMAPSAPGDSGGPLLAADGSVVAIVSGGSRWWGKPFTQAWMLAPDDLERLIAADRSGQRYNVDSSRNIHESR